MNTPGGVMLLAGGLPFPRHWWSPYGWSMWSLSLLVHWNRDCMSFALQQAIYLWHRKDEKKPCDPKRQYNMSHDWQRNIVGKGGFILGLYFGQLLISLMPLKIHILVISQESTNTNCTWLFYKLLNFPIFYSRLQATKWWI